ncbi:hypothetical protein HNP46_000387 [Pseudomonas nitritireducens]|uniref:Uncharacterized protein n=1 Tax=Pseudomonas nitroreducens TaxID=46680 RepID=A0A7W7NYL1_PSENT|nr:hypothetical protein [Pseudomonas nitritireducens]MBB4861576.1 hypothetical protein [Pseudomonas nitritireducens]
MGMFDCVRFQGGTPAGMVDEHEHFQIQDLHCLLDTFEITREGRLVQIPHVSKIPEDTNYDGELLMCGGWVDGELQEYTLTFVDGTLIEIRDHCKGTSLYLAASLRPLFV